MSKKPLLSEGTARRWAKYAGIQNESKALLEGMYKMEEEYMEEEEDLMEEEPMEEAMDDDDDILAELEEMLAEQDELDVDAEEAEADEAAMMSQEDVEAALKAGLEAMASAVADALKIKIDVRSGDEGEEMEAEEEEIMEMDDMPMEEGDYGMKYEGIDRDELVERVMKRVAARLVKESKEG